MMKLLMNLFFCIFMAESVMADAVDHSKDAMDHSMDAMDHSQHVIPDLSDESKLNVAVFLYDGALILDGTEWGRATPSD